MTPTEAMVRLEKALNSPSLNTVLESLGYTHSKAGPNTDAHHIVDAVGNLVHTGRARDVWLFLHSAGLHALVCRDCGMDIDLEEGVGCESCAPLTDETW